MSNVQAHSYDWHLQHTLYNHPHRTSLMQESLCVCAKPKRDNVTMQHRLSLAEHIHKMIPVDGKATLLEINPWGHSSPRNYLNQCWPSSMTPLVMDQLVKNTSRESIFTIMSYLEKWSKDHNSSGKLKMLTICGPLMPYGNIDLDQHWITDNSLLPNGTKPSPGQMLTYVAFTWEQFQKKCSWTWSTTCVQRLQF